MKAGLKPGHHRKPQYLTPIEVRDHLTELWAREKSTLDLLFGTQAGAAAKKRVSSADAFFLECVPVPPSRFRPASVMGDQTFESPQNTYMGNILKHNLTLLELRNPPPTKDKLGDGVVKPAASSAVADLVRIQQTWIELQNNVNNLMDSSLAGKGADKLPSGIRQMMEKKEGLFRMHMMGKRVNFACRSVISPDPYIGTHEIGIPMVFATKLTYPEPVTQYNVGELRQCVMNGPDVHPGATHVVSETGVATTLSGMTADQRKAVASQLLTPPEGGKSAASLNKKVLRHIRTGDVVLANRQPTLHKPSMMAHVVRVLPGEKTLRMHYANCNTYNADFDGDEMNVHFPQSEFARAEAYHIANTNNQYLVPTSGKPLRGLIQDHVASGTVLTSRNTMLTRDRYQYLIYMALPNHKSRIVLLPPAILKPTPLWTGKQVISTLLKNICMDSSKDDSEALSLDGTSKVPASEWGPNSEEATVIFRRGELLCGVLDKNQFGATPYGLVHACQELYGADVAGDLLTALGRLFTSFLQFRGLTCGIEDLVLTGSADEGRRELLKEAQYAGNEEVAKFVGADPGDKDAVQTGLKEVYKSNDKMAGLDAAMKTRLNQLTSNVISACLPAGARKPFPENCLALMIQSGAKGSSVNSSQISCLLGQQELEGRRVPVMVTGRSLPSFLPYDTSARSGGYVMGRFLTGIKPQEYFFHCMAGREGLVDTAVKTANSGYLQRCLIKHLESLRVQYDMTVRDVDNSVVQFNYGEDSLDVTKTAFLSKFHFMLQNESALLRKYQPGEAMGVLDTEKAPKYFKKIAKAAKKGEELPDPALSVLRPDRYLGSVSERFYSELNAFLEKDGGLKDSKQLRNNFQAVMSLKYRDALCHPGEAVGLLAAQSVGEPSTQMTLNTFHFAGFGAMNVTLGIPRLREILMTASKDIKTPAMTLPMLPSLPSPAAEATKMKHKLSRLVMSDIVKDIAVHEWLAKPDKAAGDRYRMYKLRIDFDTDLMASPEIQLKVFELFKGLQTGFARQLQLEINKHLKRTTGAKVVLGVRGKAGAKDGEEGDDMDEDQDNEEEKAPRKKGAGKGTESASEEEMDVDSDVDADGENDASTAKELRNKTAASTYDDDDEDSSDSSSSDDEDETDEKKGDDDDESESKAAAAAAKASEAKDSHIAAMLNMSVRFAEYDVSETGEWMELTLRLPSHTRKLLLLSIVEQLMDTVVIRSSPGIKRCMVGDPPKGSTVPVLQTEGVNIREMWKYGSVLDVNRIYSNDIVAILNTYGVEAARAAVMREVSGVFKVYGIAVDMRHLSLIADYMTFEGGYKPFNRIGIESNTSPFAKMSFETTMHFMRNAVLTGDYDTLDSPSARLVVGRVVEGGTGCFDLLHPLA